MQIPRMVRSWSNKWLFCDGMEKAKMQNILDMEITLHHFGREICTRRALTGKFRYYLIALFVLFDMEESPLGTSNWIGCRLICSFLFFIRAIFTPLLVNFLPQEGLIFFGSIIGNSLFYLSARTWNGVISLWIFLIVWCNVSLSVGKSHCLCIISPFASNSASLMFQFSRVIQLSFV